MDIGFYFKVMALSVGASAAAAQGGAGGSASDPAVPVPTVPYRSAFSDRPSGVEPARDDWKRANAEVGRFTRGHPDILKWEQQQAPDASKPQAPDAHKH